MPHFKWMAHFSYKDLVRHPTETIVSFWDGLFSRINSPLVLGRVRFPTSNIVFGEKPIFYSWSSWTSRMTLLVGWVTNPTVRDSSMGHGFSWDPPNGRVNDPVVGSPGGGKNTSRFPWKTANDHRFISNLGDPWKKQQNNESNFGHSFFSASQFFLYPSGPLQSMLLLVTTVQPIHGEKFWKVQNAMVIAMVVVHVFASEKKTASNKRFVAKMYPCRSFLFIYMYEIVCICHWYVLLWSWSRLVMIIIIATISIIVNTVLVFVSIIIIVVTCIIAMNYHE